MSLDLITSADWRTDCLRWRGLLLVGRFAHWCWDWDGLPVDETTPEFQGCCCFDDWPASP